MPDEPYQKSGQCSNCKAPRRATLHVHLRQSGAKGYMWVCNTCNKRNPFNGDLFVANETVEARLTQQQIAVLPVIMPDFSERCARCGSRWAEKHHWAPKAIFGDVECEQWPKDYLCKECHDRWHELVTPQISKKAKNG